MLCPNLKGSPAGGVPLTPKRVRLFVLFRPSIDWMRPTYMRRDNLLYSVY